MSDYWDKHYDGFIEQSPSNFSQWVSHKYLHPDDNLIEIGCGNGRDALLLAGKVKQYTGIDISEIALNSANSNMINKGFDNFKLIKGSFANLDEKLLDIYNRNILYSRFSLHSDTSEVEDKFLSKLHKFSNVNLLGLIEVRTIYDELYGVGNQVNEHAFVTDHYRRFIDPNEIYEKISSKFIVNYFELSRNFAPYKNENPTVLRIVFSNMKP